MNKIHFIVYTPAYVENSGGVMVLYNLARNLKELDHDVKIITFENMCPQNILCNNYGTTKDITDESIVIYPEVIRGNPLNAKRVIRWILCDLGKHTSVDIYKTWSKSDMVYYYSSYNSNNHKKLNYLFSLYINPLFRVINTEARQGSVFVVRKAQKFHKTVTKIHSSDSQCLSDDLSHDQLINVFNRVKYLFCYDPYTWVAFIAALCGCIPIVYPIDGVTKKQWMQTLYCRPYLEHVNKDYMYGVAYGLSDVKYAHDTIHLVKEEQDALVKFGEQTVTKMIDDMNDSRYQTVEDVFYN